MGKVIIICVLIICITIMYIKHEDRKSEEAFWKEKSNNNDYDDITSLDDYDKD